MSKHRTRNSHAARKFRAFILARDKGVCWLCGQPGADTVDHTPFTVDERPDLQFNPANARAAHGRSRPEYNCPGQFSLGITYENEKRKAAKLGKPAERSEPAPSRQWIRHE